MGRKEFFCSGKFVRVCGLAAAWYEPIDDPEPIVASLHRSGVHIFTFFQRVPHTEPRFKYYMERYEVAVIKLINYNYWWRECINKKTRQSVKMAVKRGVEVRVVPFDEHYIRGIHQIYNETPIRQGRRFLHYGDSIEKVRKENGTFFEKSLYLGAYYGEELVGFMRIVIEDQFADVLQLLSKMAHRDKGVNNALLAKGVEICSARGIGYLVYGDLKEGGLDDFKRHNGFSVMELPRYYIPLNWFGEVALKMKLHKEVSDMLPRPVVSVLKGLRRRWYLLMVGGRIKNVKVIECQEL